METIQRDYAPKGVNFYYIYKALAHPERNGYVTPFTIEERLMHVQEAKQRLGSRIDWLCDTMSNDLKHALGNAQNSEYVTDPAGVIVSRKAWSNPEELRKLLSELVGPVDPPTQVADLNMKMQLEPQYGEISTGVLPRLQLNERTMPLKIEPVLTEGDPFYVKLRAEATSEFFEKGKGKLYLGFHLDRLYAVHWNNLVKPLEFELTFPETIQIEPKSGVGPKLQEPADKDPREFLLEISAKEAKEPLHLTLRYFACDDAGTFCKAVVQHYAIHLEKDPDGGSFRRGSGIGMRPGAFVERMCRRDRNGDGKLSLDEIPEFMKRRFQSMDQNGDGFLDEKEFQSTAGRMMGGGGRGQMVERMMRRDANGDGKISREEAPEPMLRRFDQMDTDQDGFIDEAELRAAAVRMRGRPGSRP